MTALSRGNQKDQEENRWRITKEAFAAKRQHLQEKEYSGEKDKEGGLRHDKSGKKKRDGIYRI